MAALVPGARFTAHFEGVTIHGNLGPTHRPAKAEGREVVRVTSEAIHFRKPCGGETVLDTPLAAEVAIVDGTFVITGENGRHVVTYVPERG